MSIPDDLIYDPKIYHKWDGKGKEYEILSRVKRYEYYNKVIFHILDYTEGHNIALLQLIWDKGSNDNSRIDIRRNFPKNSNLGKIPITVIGKQNKLDFIRREGNYKYHPAVFLSKNKNSKSFFLLSIAFEPNYRELTPINKYGHVFGLLDIEVSDIDEHEARPYVYDACKVLNEMEYVTLPDYTGGSWHVWFRKKNFSSIGFFAKKDEPKEDSVNEIIEKVAKEINISIKSGKNGMRHIKGIVNLDYRGGNQPRSYVHCPLALHRKSGLVSVPLRIKEINKFDINDSHPINVLEKLDLYSFRLNEFFIDKKKFEHYDPNFKRKKKPKLPNGQRSLKYYL